MNRAQGSALKILAHLSNSRRARLWLKVGSQIETEALIGENETANASNSEKIDQLQFQ